MSCVAPVLYASTDCSRWLAEYKQGVLQRRMTHHLRAAKYRLTAMVHKPAPVHHYPTRHRLSPLESLHRFQIDCGDFPEAPAAPPLPPPPTVARVELPLQPLFAQNDFPEDIPPTLPAFSTADVPPQVPALINVPTTPVESVPTALPTPEPSSFLLLLTGAVLGAEVYRRRKTSAAVLE